MNCSKIVFGAQKIFFFFVCHYLIWIKIVIGVFLAQILDIHVHTKTF